MVDYSRLIPLFTIILSARSLNFDNNSHLRRHADHHKLAHKRALPAGWTAQGCWSDDVAVRTLSAKGYVSGIAMTPDACVNFCDLDGYIYAGVEYGAECYCDNTLRNNATQAAAGDCNMLCSGSADTCGGPGRLNLYWSGEAPPVVIAPEAPDAYENWQRQGCYTDSVAIRTLPIGVGVNGPMTIEKCLVACESAGYIFAGTEYAVECFCANAIGGNGELADDSTCNMSCAGNQNQICGGPNRLNVYRYAPSTSTISATSTTSSASPTGTYPTTLESYGLWLSQGCYIDNPGARTIPNPVGITALTPEKCMDACYAAGYNYAGMEYSVECYCSNGIQNGGLPANDGCTMVCAGNGNYYCGGPYRVNVYKYDGIVPPPENPPGGGGDVPPPVTVGLPGTWHYDGCWVDNQFGRILSYAGVGGVTNTIESCVALCDSLGFKVAGTEYGVECYCGNAIVQAGTKAVNQNDCNMPCAGNANEGCGGPNRVSVYASINPIPVIRVPTPKTTGLPGDFEYVGCYSEPGALRVLPYLVEDEMGQTVEKCLAKCSEYGYPAAGLEYGKECWCGDITDIVANGGLAAPANDCNIPCSGSPTDLCGGIQRFNLYTWSKSDLIVWHNPENKGHYELLIGGVVIPLIATLGINNKVTFLEKFGTGAPNTTGAYELDYSLANDYTKAWREMHVKSDVFCAANVILPDRTGRQLSVGGWSFESTEGVRLYTPSGSIGVNGTTDWDENWNEIHLQRGRWYPGLMIMANGSVLVIGGENGSNGYPIPNLEILPKPEGGDTVLEMEWLLRTDPNNLYPFMFVLPGGGIFVIYYNEAIILNEVTFATTKTFPIIPGSVNAAGGRTYPMEGTSMMLPQKAPYSEPVEILTCGGSSFGQAFDNCVSIVPEGDGQWVIERMPTRRVMTIMAALPDGTYLIMGGAKAGVAGFGLANTPNYQALLYDPSRPRNQRISILGETIVPRMYHSEATLLHDGRVLVSGSDPQDGVNPQEYRMEVYVPPYLTDGRIQPTFTITNIDWGYGTLHSFTVTSHTNSLATLRVSLMGAVSSTHGNSFGQRTIFPAVTCNGNVCQVESPPNSHICPPGWYQMFILDGPTPSHSTWVRIGGDPAGLGNWPPFNDFTKPGVGPI